MIFVFGPSCSGKSTLAQALHLTLGNNWSYVDRDVLIEDGSCTDETANAVLDEKIRKAAKNLIIDAQIPWRKKAENERFFLVLPPLNVLLQRDAERTKFLERSSEKAEAAKQYVIETFEQLSTASDQFDLVFDSSKSAVQEEIQEVITLLKSERPQGSP